MRRLLTAAVVLVLALALGGIGALAAPAKPKKVATKVTLKFVAGAPAPDPYTQPGADTFEGKVKPKTKSKKLKRKCRKNRTVKVKRAGGPTVGQTTTNKKGRYSITVDNAAPGQYFAKATKRTVTVKGKNVVCKGGKSKTITVS